MFDPTSNFRLSSHILLGARVFPVSSRPGNDRPSHSGGTLITQS
jgi:hypothetical protein